MTAVEALKELIEDLKRRHASVQDTSGSNMPNPNLMGKSAAFDISLDLAKSLLVRAKAEEEDGATRIAAKCNEKSGELWRRYKSGPPEDRGNSYLEGGSDALDEFAQSIARTLSPTPEDAA
jgi:hypothetical protein